jgi:hypothetical protein
MPLEDSYKLAAILDNDATRAIVVKAAEQLERSGTHQSKSAKVLIKMLIDAPARSSRSSVFKREYNIGTQGRVAVARNSKGKVTFSFGKGITAENREDVVAAITTILDDLTITKPVS